MKKIPNLEWLLGGVFLTVLFIVRTQSLGSGFLQIGYFLIGLPISLAYLVFLNPKDQKARFDISICVPIFAALFPLTLLLLAVQKPWSSKAWKDGDWNGEATDE